MKASRAGMGGQDWAMVSLSMQSDGFSAFSDPGF
jgi:hypothetical protein